ncbi:hypothetical protein PLICRDRAFT_86269 [Plicaturopsis crispa FD-325 SS-3]|nr:hypothetical protein PLICRDRAFT_86269 [Plicaturopsis crispa FD-325 SS-3]
MARFRAPSTSTATSSAAASSREPTPVPVARPIPGARHRMKQMDQKGKGKAEEGRRSETPEPSRNRRVRSSGAPLPKKKKIEHAKKKQAVKTQFKTREETHVFVGNLPFGISEEQVRRIFSRCGPVVSVTICCGRGTIATAGQVLSGSRARNSQHYAIIVFNGVRCVRRALDLNGKRVGATPLCGTLQGGFVPEVCLTAADLPMIQDMVRKFVNERGHPAPRAPGPGAPLARGESTWVDVSVPDIPEDAPAPPEGRNKFLGFLGKAFMS